MGVVPFLMFSLMGGLSLWLGVHGLMKGAASKHWRKVGGCVNKVAIECHTREGGQDKYAARVDYEYVFEGRLLRGSLGYPSNTHRATAAQAAAHYSAGQRIDVFVDERKPSRHALAQGVDVSYLTPVLIGAGFLVFACWMFLKA
jgi:hypothetical protein